MLTLENVTKQLDRFKLDGISMELPAGYICGLIGENGAGKTTLIHILCGLYQKSEGSIRFEGMEYKEHEADIKQEIGVVLHGDLFDMASTLLNNANRYGRAYRRYDEKLFLKYAQRFGLSPQRKYKKLSKGEKLKFAFAFALSHQPKLLLLDEPTANFDSDFRKEFFEILREYTASGENSVILSTHLTTDIDKLADYLLFLQNGKQVLFGDIESVRGAYRIVAGEAYKIKLLQERVIHMEEGEFGCKALVHHSKRPYDEALKVWEPSTEELMYYMVKRGTCASERFRM